MIVAIDGPAGAGKSTLAQRLAERLGFQLIETGALYRSVALLALEHGVELDDDESLAEIAAALEVSFGYIDGVNHIWVHGEERTKELRRGPIGNAASEVSQHPAVREELLELQRTLGREDDSVMEGRDIGTVVFPDAELKVFVTASPQERASRRYQQMTAESPSEAADYDTVLADIIQRDERDRTRVVAPLTQAEDAVLIDTTDLSIDEAEEQLIELIDTIS